MYDICYFCPLLWSQASLWPQLNHKREHYAPKINIERTVEAPHPQVYAKQGKAGLCGDLDATV